MEMRSHAEIEAFLTHPKHIALIRKAALASSTSGASKKRALARKRAVAELLLKSVFGEKVFDGPHGSALRAVSKLDGSTYKFRGGLQRKVGGILDRAVTHLQFPLWSLDPDKFGRSLSEQQDAVHELKTVTQNFKGQSYLMLNPQLLTGFRKNQLKIRRLGASKKR